MEPDRPLELFVKAECSTAHYCEKLAPPSAHSHQPHSSYGNPMAWVHPRPPLFHHNHEDCVQAKAWMAAICSHLYLLPTLSMTSSPLAPRKNKTLAAMEWATLYCTPGLTDAFGKRGLHAGGGLESQGGLGESVFVLGSRLGRAVAFGCLGQREPGHLHWPPSR